MTNNVLTVYLLRHGQTDMNADRNRYCGRTDAQLTELGHSQAKNAGELLREIDFAAVFASPLQRSRKTAELLEFPLPVQVDERLIELDFGGWEGMTREEVIEKMPETWELWNQDPLLHPAGGDGETAQSLIDRVEDFFEEAVEKYMGKNILVVGHNGLNRLFLSYKLQMPVQNYRWILQENSAITRFVMGRNGEFQLQRLNCR